MNGASTGAGALRCARISSQWPSPPQKPSEASSAYCKAPVGQCQAASAKGARISTPPSGV